MQSNRSIAEWMADRGATLEGLAKAATLDYKLVRAIVRGQYTASPQQRQRLASALGVTAEQIDWGHTMQVEHMYGHGPQFGRSP
jgi:hypothetical protein